MKEEYKKEFWIVWIEGIQMNKLVIHIGSPKTWTSSIQSFLSENEGILNEQGWSYPDTYSKWNAIIGETSSYTVERRKQVNGQLLYEVFGAMDKELSDKYINMLKQLNKFQTDR